jgi:hypothetical protein
MTTDREWDIFMMEIEARNKALIEEFLLGKMRPRDLEQLMEAQESPEEALEREAYGI